MSDGPVKITFPRLPDGTRAYCVVERSDKVRYRVYAGVAGPRVPHDLVHLVAERSTGQDRGFWGAVAAGAVFSSMRHLDGRRPPHAAERSAAAIRGHSDGLLRAELMADLVERVAEERITSVDRVRAVAAEVLSTLPDPTVDESRVIAAAESLREVADRWAGLSPGDELVMEWPGPWRH